MSSYNIALYSGNANKPLAESIALNLGISLADAKVKSFKDGEINVEIGKSVRGHDVYVIQPTCPPKPSNNLMELLVMIDALKRSSAKRITAVLPYYGFARQDRRPWSSRVPITARLVANMITAAGADRVLTIDLHADQIQGFFNIPVDNLYTTPVFNNIIKDNVANPTIVSPDVGGVVRARALAKGLKVDLAIIDKRRSKENESEVMNIIGDVRQRDCVIFDDIVDTAGTLCKAAVALKKAGASSVIACCTHAVLSGEAVSFIENSPLDQLYVSNSIPLQPEAAACSKIKPVCVAKILGQSISRIHREESMNSMYRDNQVLR